MQLPKRKPGKFSQSTVDPHITQAKFDELDASLTRLKKLKPKVAKEMAEHAQMGDFSENAEYQAAKRRLRGINSKILILENQLNRAIIIDPKKSDVVEIGHTVTVLFDGKEKKYQILGSSETDPTKGIISQHSPIGAALIGRKAGDVVSVEIAGKKRKITITQVT